MSPFAYSRAAHPCRDDWLLARDADFRDGSSGGRRVGHRLRRQDDQHRINVLVFEDNFRRRGVPVRLGVTEYVHGVAMRPVRWQKLVEFFDGIIAKPG